MTMVTDDVIAELSHFVRAGSTLSEPDILRALGEFTLICIGHTPTNQTAAVVMLRGSEIHLFIREAYRGWFMTPRRIRSALAMVEAEHGFVTTRVRADDADKIALVKRFRFTPTWSDGIYQFFMYTGSKQ